MRALGVLSAYESGLATAVNDRGVVVGYSARSYRNPGDPQSSTCYRAVVWDKGRIADLGVLGGAKTCLQASSYTTAINNNSQIAGSSRDRAVLWTFKQG